MAPRKTRKAEQTPEEKVSQLGEQEISELAIKLLKENSEIQTKLDVSTFAFEQIPEVTDEYEKLANQSHEPVLVKEQTLSYEPSGSGAAHPKTILVEGDNLPSLIALDKEYRDTVDVIYIDPPYNTGNDFVYNDKRKTVSKGKLSKGNLFKHSAWLSFMERRITVAKDMMKEDGIILTSIGDHEYAHLKLLMDEIFGEENYIGTITWQGSPSSLSSFTSGGVDYIVAYGKNIKKSQKWKMKKPHVDKMMLAVKKVHDKSKDSKVSTDALRSFIAKNKSKLGKGLTSYNKVDSAGRIYSDSSLTNSLYRPNLKYPITDPSTGVVYHPPYNGWKLSEDRMNDLVAKDLVLFEGRKYPRKKMLLSEYMYALPTQSFSASRTQGSVVLKNILGAKQFHFPKNVEVIKAWVGAVCDKTDAVILDFFAGSGTTGQAVAELNAEDGGTRTCIMVTNNENDIARNVTQKRMQRVLSGKNWADGKEHEELPGSLEYFLLDWEEKDCPDSIQNNLRNAGLLPEIVQS